MPHFVVPKHSGVHRIASIALFRALLSSCKTVPLPPETRSTLQDVIRNKFKRNQDVHSKKLLTQAFQAGYEALDLLHTVHSGNLENGDFIRGLIEETPQYLKRAPVIGPLLVHTKPAKKYQPRPENSILARPHLNLSGKRMIPTLVIANRIPFLRTTKPQSKVLSAFIRGRIKQRQERYDRKQWLASMIQLADLEDDWDDSLENDHDVDRQDQVPRYRWSTEYRADLTRVADALGEEQRKNKKMAVKLSDIIEKEKELAASEAAERKNQKKERKISGDHLKDSDSS